MLISKKGTYCEKAEEAKFQPNVLLQILLFVAVIVVGAALTLLLRGIIIGICMLMHVELSGIRINNLMALYSTVGGSVIALLYCTYIEKRSLASMGLVKKGFLKRYVIGLALGFSIFTVCTLISYLCGGLEFAGFTLGNNLGWILLFLGGFILQGMQEEILLRGYFMTSLSNKMSLDMAIVINAVLFGVLHVFNGGITVLAIVNLILFGLFASLYAVRTNNIWGIAGFHTAWNFVQGNVYGIKVSGNLVDASVMSFGPKGADLLSGGDFGIEGSIITTLVLGISCVALVLWRRKEVDIREIALNR